MGGAGRLTDVQYEDIKQTLAKMSFDKLEDEVQSRVNKQVM
jgi:hypothetical protein